MKLINASQKVRVASFSTIFSVVVAGAVLVASPMASAQSRPPVTSGAAGGANPGTGGAGYNPGNNGGGGYNPGNSGGGGYNPGNTGGGGYNPGNNGGGGYNPGGNGGGYNPGHGSDYNPGYGGSYNPGYNGRYSATVYRDENYRGSSAQFSGDVSNLDNSGLNDRISSIRLQGTWLACSDAYFRGRCIVLRNSTRDLRAYRMSDQISSLRPLR
jgi:hypothetical protein